MIFPQYELLSLFFASLPSYRVSIREFINTKVTSVLLTLMEYWCSSLACDFRGDSYQLVQEGFWPGMVFEAPPGK